MTKINWNEPIQTIDGRKARLLCDDYNEREGCNYLIAIVGGNGFEGSFMYKQDGTSPHYVNNIINVPKELEKVWFNIYKTRNNYETSRSYISRNIAEHNTFQDETEDWKFYKTIEIEI